MEKITTILESIRPDIDFDQETRLIDDGILKSFDVISIIGELNGVFDINIGVEDLIPENFNSVERIELLVKRLLEG